MKQAVLVKQYQRKHQNLFLISRNSKEGLDSAHKLGFNYAKKNSYENLITLDADLSHDPNVIPKFIELLKEILS